MEVIVCAAEAPNELLSRVAREVANIEDREQQQEISACTQVLAGLRFNKASIANFFREEIMQESVIYQDILQKGRQQGLEQGKQQEAIAMIMRPLTRRFGTLGADVRERISSLTTAQLEDLNEALFDFSEVADLVASLESR